MVTNEKIFSIKHGKNNWCVVRCTDISGTNVYRLMKNRQRLFRERWRGKCDYAEDPRNAIRVLLAYVLDEYSRSNIFDNINK